MPLREHMLYGPTKYQVVVQATDALTEIRDQDEWKARIVFVSEQHTWLIDL